MKNLVSKQTISLRGRGKKVNGGGGGVKVDISV